MTGIEELLSVRIPAAESWQECLRVLVTGSREWGDREAVWAALDEVTSTALRVILVHGHCPSGADAFADAWGAVRSSVRGPAPQYVAPPIAVERHPADWKGPCVPGCTPGHRRRNNGGEYCPQAGLRRNAQMVALGADLCLAFIKGRSAGATNTMRLAEKAGIPTRRWTA